MSEPELLKRFQCGCQLSLRPVTIPDWDTSELPSLCFESRALRDTVGKAEVGSSGQWEGNDEVEKSEVRRAEKRVHTAPSSLLLFSMAPFHIHLRPWRPVGLSRSHQFTLPPHVQILAVTHLYPKPWGLTLTCPYTHSWVPVSVSHTGMLTLS